MSERAVRPAIDVELTADGCARRADMLGDLLGRMDDLHRARRRRRRIVAGAHLLAIALLIAGLVPTASVPVTGPVVEAPPVLPPALPPDALPPPVRLALVETDPSIVDRYQVVPASRTTIVDDHTLLGALASIDRPTGLVRRDGRMWLTDDVLTPSLP